MFENEEDVCCANGTPGLKSITISKRKLNNKHTQKIKEFTWFNKPPTLHGKVEEISL